MKARKTLSRLAAMFMAVMLLAALAIVPAGATSVTEGDTFTITKYINKESTTMTPNVTINFTVSPADPDTNETRNGIPVTKGEEGAVTQSSGAVFEPGDSLDEATTVSANASFAVDVSKFDEAGIYKYQVTENNVVYGALTVDTNVLYLYVYIQLNSEGKLYVAYTELVDPDGGGNGVEAKTDSFTNDYDSAGDSLHDLTVYKVVSGNAANMSDKFEFTITINGESGEKYYVEFGTYVDGTFTSNGTTMIITSGVTSDTISLGNADAFKVYGLDSDDSYTITEKDANTDGYLLKIDDATDNDGITTGTISSDTVVKYENSKNASTPTGIITTFAPYALMVVVAAGACFFFLRRRNAAED